MSSYLTIYAVDSKKKQAVEIYCCSRNSEIYQAVTDSFGNIFYLGDSNIDCKEWYASRCNDDKSKYVEIKEEAIEPIPENEEYNKWVETRKGDIPERVYYRYFIKEEYDNLPTHYELITTKYTDLKERIPSVICELNHELNKDQERLKYYDAIAKTNVDAINDAIEWKEYVQDKQNTLDFFKHLNMLDCELRCCID